MARVANAKTVGAGVVVILAAVALGVLLVTGTIGSKHHDHAAGLASVCARYDAATASATADATSSYRGVSSAALTSLAAAARTAAERLTGSPRTSAELSSAASLERQLAREIESGSPTRQALTGPASRELTQVRARLSIVLATAHVDGCAGL